MLGDLENVSLGTLAWGTEIVLQSTRKLKNTPHVIGGRYPCRSAPHIPNLVLREYAQKTNSTEFVVLDPFMGSGTTAIEATKFTSRVYGLEIDPYARLVASVSSFRYSENDINEFRRIGADIISVGPGIKVDEGLAPSLTNIQYWFDETQFDDLLILKSAIFANTKDNPKVRDFMLTAFGDIVRGCSKAERQSLKPYISTRFTKTPLAVFSSFEKALERYLLGVSRSAQNLSDGIVWGDGTATKFDLPEKVDVAVTSPPYINAMDYTRCIKLESAWIGTADDAVLAKIRAGQLGEAIRSKTSEPSIDVRRIVSPYLLPIENQDKSRFDTALTYFHDMSENLSQVHSALKTNGEYHIIIGNSKIRGISVPTHEILAKLAESAGFHWSNYIKYPIKDHRTSIPRNGNGGKIEHEHVISLVKK